MSLVFRVRRPLLELVRERSRVPVAVSPSPADAAMARVERLHDTGALSDAEFEAVKSSTRRRVPPD